MFIRKKTSSPSTQYIKKYLVSEKGNVIDFRPCLGFMEQLKFESTSGENLETQTIKLSSENLENINYNFTFMK